MSFFLTSHSFLDLNEEERNKFFSYKEKVKQVFDETVEEIWDEGMYGFDPVLGKGMSLFLSDTHIENSFCLDEDFDLDFARFVVTKALKKMQAGAKKIQKLPLKFDSFQGREKYIFDKIRPKFKKCKFWHPDLWSTIKFGEDVKNGVSVDFHPPGIDSIKMSLSLSDEQARLVEAWRLSESKNKSAFVSMANKSIQIGWNSNRSGQMIRTYPKVIF